MASTSKAVGGLHGGEGHQELPEPRPVGEAGDEGLAEVPAPGLVRHPVDHLAGEAEDEDAPGGGLVEAPAAQVEEGALVELAHGGAVAALHVVGVDGEVGLGVHLGLAGEQEVAVLLGAAGLLGVGTDHDGAVEDRGALPVEDALVDLAAGGPGRHVVDEGVVVEELGAPGEVEAVEGGLGAHAGEGHVEVEARQLPPEGEDPGVVAAAASRSGRRRSRGGRRRRPRPRGAGGRPPRLRPRGPR